MTKHEYKQGAIDQLRSIKETALNVLGLIELDDIDYKSIETSMNYIRLCTQKVQWNSKNYFDFPCKSQDTDVLL
jgi:hypothetical protein